MAQVKSHCSFSLGEWWRRWKEAGSSDGCGGSRVKWAWAEAGSRNQEEGGGKDASEIFNWHNRMNGGVSTQLRNTGRRRALGEVGWGSLGHELKMLLKY